MTNNPAKTRDRHAAASVVAHARLMLAQRLGHDLFSTPALDMLLHLYLREDHRPIWLASLCSAADAPSRTALRAIDRLVSYELLSRSSDEADRRRINVALTPKAYAMMDQLFDELVALLPQITG